MSSITRQLVVDGPGTLTHGSTKLHAAENIDATAILETWRPNISTHGPGGLRLKDARGEIKFKPTGNITQGLIDLLYPAALRNPVTNTSMHGTTDVALLIHAMSGEKVTFINAALAGMPDLILSPEETAIGDVTFNALIGNGLNRSAASSLYTKASATWSESFPEVEIITVPYVGVWNGVTFYTEKGWKVTFGVTLEQRKVSNEGTTDYKLKSVTARASCTPLHMNRGGLLDELRPQGLAIGASMRQGRDLVITGGAGGLVVTLYDATMTAGPAQWGPTRLAAGEVGFEANRRIVTGNLAELFAISIAA